MATKTQKKIAPATSKTTAAPAKTPAVKAPSAQSKAEAKKALPAAKPANAPAKTAQKPTAAPPASKAASAATTQAAQSAKSAAKPVPPQAAAPTAPSQQKWEEIRQLLIQMKEATLREIARAIKNGSEATVGEETTGDIYDQASSERDRELGLLLSDRERQKLHNIDDALLRIQEGEYGICEECDEEIPLGRLKAMPLTRHCVKCKSDLERLQAQTRRFEEDRAYREIPLGDEEEG